MMTSYRRNSSRYSGRTLALLAVSIAAVLVFGLNLLLGGRIQAAVQSGATFAWSAVAHVMTSIDQNGWLASRQSLAEENIALRAKIASIDALETANKVLADDNAALRLSANVRAASSSSITVPVLSRPDTSPYGTFVISAGSLQGITKGSFVYAEGGVLLGTISDVSKESALVGIFLSPGVQTKGHVGTTTDLVVTGHGDGNGTASVPRDTPVSVGDPVYFTDLHSVIGIVGSVSSSPSDAEKTIYLRVPVNLFGLRYLSVVPQPL